MYLLKTFVFNILFICIFINVNAQSSKSNLDSLTKASNIQSGQYNHRKSFIQLPKSTTPKWSLPKIKYARVSELVASTKPVFSVLAGASFAKQVVNAGGYSSKFNYKVADIQKDNYVPGFFAGVRMDGTYQNKHPYSLSASIGKLASGSTYAPKAQFSVDPTIGYSSFKAEGQLYVLNLAAHYKKIIPFGNQGNHQLYVVAGPSITTRLFGTSTDNEVTDAYKRIFFKGDIGLEWNNRKAYTYFLHYQHSLGSITKSSIQNNLNVFELGVFTSAREIF